MGKISGHKDLNVWKKSMQFVLEIYSLTSHFPKEEIYGLTSQIRRAAVSIPSNIAEGAARQTQKEFCQFLYVSMGSLAELETQLIIAQNLKYIETFDNQSIDEIRKMLNGLIYKLR
jgi:four helix bundle protein